MPLPTLKFLSLSCPVTNCRNMKFGGTLDNYTHQNVTNIDVVKLPKYMR